MLRGDFLETRQVLARSSSVTLPLKRSGQSEFRRSMKGIQSQPPLERRNGFVVFLQLRIQIAGKIIGVRFVGGDIRDVLKRGDALLRFPKIFLGKSEVVPGESILRKLLRRRFERRACQLQLLLGEQRNSQIQPGHRELGVGLQRLLEILLRVRRALLVHVCNTQRIEAEGLRDSCA